MKEGDLVNVYAITRRGKEGPAYRGIYVGWDSSDDGWIVMVNGAIETFLKGWWICERISTK